MTFQLSYDIRKLIVLMREIGENSLKIVIFAMIYFEVEICIYAPTMLQILYILKNFPSIYAIMKYASIIFF